MDTEMLDVVLSLLFKNQVLWLTLLEQFLWTKKLHFQFPKAILIGLMHELEENWLTPRSVGKDWANRIGLMGAYGNYNCEKTT